jgi:hypothetical protein
MPAEDTLAGAKWQTVSWRTGRRAAAITAYWKCRPEWLAAGCLGKKSVASDKHHRRNGLQCAQKRRDPIGEPIRSTADCGMSSILIVEDEVLTSEYLEFVLEEAGYEAIPAAGADEAIAVLEHREDVDLVATDINLPGAPPLSSFGRCMVFAYMMTIILA